MKNDPSHIGDKHPFSKRFSPTVKFGSHRATHPNPGGVQNMKAANSSMKGKK